MDGEYKDRLLWERLYAREEERVRKGLEERSWAVGEDSEEVFDKIVLEVVEGKDAIDIGCGFGEFTLV